MSYLGVIKEVANCGLRFRHFKRKIKVRLMYLQAKKQEISYK